MSRISHLSAAICIGLLIVVTSSASEAQRLKRFWAGWQREVKERGVAPEVYAERFAKESTPNLLPEMVRDLRDDKSDERFFGYVLVMVNWDPHECRGILRKEMRSNNEKDRIWAEEFLTELQSFQEAKRKTRLGR